MGTINWKKNMTRDELFWSKVDQQGPSDCWEWKASKNRDGYGQFWIGNTFIPAHRYVWEFKNDTIPDGYQILHHCDNPSCCNPNHLFLGTHSDNMNDKMLKGRSKKIGIKRNFTTEQKLIIKELNKNGISQTKIASVLEVTPATIRRILKGVKHEK